MPNCRKGPENPNGFRPHFLQKAPNCRNVVRIALNCLRIALRIAICIARAKRLRVWPICGGPPLLTDSKKRETGPAMGTDVIAFGYTNYEHLASSTELPTPASELPSCVSDRSDNRCMGWTLFLVQKPEHFK